MAEEEKDNNFANLFYFTVISIPYEREGPENWGNFCNSHKHFYNKEQENFQARPKVIL